MGRFIEKSNPEQDNTNRCVFNGNLVRSSVLESALDVFLTRKQAVTVSNDSMFKRYILFCGSSLKTSS